MGTIKVIKIKESLGLPIAVIIVQKIEKRANNKYPKARTLKGFSANKKFSV